MKSGTLFLAFWEKYKMLITVALQQYHPVTSKWYNKKHPLMTSAKNYLHGTLDFLTKNRFDNFVHMFTTICWQVKLRTAWCCHHHLDLLPRNWAVWTTSTSSSVFGFSMLTPFEWYPLLAFTRDLCIEFEASFEVWRSLNKGKLSSRKCVSGLFYGVWTSS